MDDGLVPGRLGPPPFPPPPFRISESGLAPQPDCLHARPWVRCPVSTGWLARPRESLASNATMSSTLCSCAIKTVLRNAAHNRGHSGEIGDAPN